MSLNIMQLFRSVLLFAILLVLSLSHAFGQDNTRKEEKTPVNQLDSKGRKHGMWWTTHPPRMGEPGFTEFGAYDHGNKLGPWYKIDGEGDLVSIESFRNNVLDGEAKYFEKGQLYCTGHYRGLNPKQDFDTIVVMDPITQEESFRVISTERGSLRHGTWRYFDPISGHMLKEEEYQVDELVYKKEFESFSKADSVAIRNKQLAMPHNKKVKYTPPPSKQHQYITN